MGKLSNGMTYYIRENQKPENRAELRLAVKAGAMQEDEDQLGLAHFVEHMAFNGTKSFSKNEIVDYLEKVGTRFGPDLNAYTSFDETVYMLQVRTDDQEQFDKGMKILQEWASSISFDSTEIDKERGVVISEWRSGLSADERMFNQYLPVLYYQSRYASRLPIGKPEIINHASYDVVKRFYRDWYRPELMAIIVVGTINADTIEQQIKDLFGGIQPETLARKKESDVVPDHDATFIKVITDAEATNAEVQIYYKHDYQKIQTTLDYRTNLIHNLYNRMLGRRLSDLSKTMNPPFIFGFTAYRQDVGNLATYSSFAAAEPKDISRAFHALLEENQRVLQHGFTESELQREKANLLRTAEQNVLEEDKLESNRLIGRLVYHYLDDNPIPNAQQVMEMYQSMMPTIQLDEVNHLAKKWITDHNRVIILTGPEKDKDILPDSARLQAMLDVVGSRNMEPYLDVDLSAPLLEGAFPETPILGYQVNDDLGLHSWELSNGIQITAKPTDFKNDEILMSAYSPGGHSIYPDAMYPSARGTSSIVGNSGVGAYDAPGLEKKLTGIRVSVRPFIFERFEGFSGSSSVRDLETMMQLVYAYAVNYREDTVALGSYLKREKGMYSNLMADPQNWFFDRISRIISRNHPRRAFPAPESYDEVDMKEVMKVYFDRFKDLSDMDFFFVGNFDVENLKKLTSRYLGALPGGGRDDTWKDIGDRFPEGPIDSVFNRGTAPKTLVQLVYHGTDTYHPDTAYLLQSLIEVARIKLREELREEEGGVYGVSISGSQVNHPVEQYSIRISFNADPPRAQELVNSCMEVIETLKSEIDPDDIVKITETQRQSRIKDLKQNQFWMSSLINSWINKTDLTQAVALEMLEKRISSLQEDELKKAARKYFSDRELIRVMMHPEKT
jgi:zinc protease